MLRIHKSIVKCNNPRTKEVQHIESNTYAKKPEDYRQTSTKTVQVEFIHQIHVISILDK